jgi:hypothetical protein
MKERKCKNHTAGGGGTPSMSNKWHKWNKIKVYDYSPHLKQFQNYSSLSFSDAINNTKYIQTTTLQSCYLQKENVMLKHMPPCNYYERYVAFIRSNILWGRTTTWTQCSTS